MGNTKETVSPNRKGVVHLVFYLAIVVLYSWSLIGVGGSAIILFLVLTAGEVHIKNSQLLVLGLIMFYPLHQLKRYMDKEWEFRIKR